MIRSASWMFVVVMIGSACSKQPEDKPAPPPQQQPKPGQAPAQTPAQPPAGPPGRMGPPGMGPAPEMAKLAYFDGVWTCDVDAIAVGHIPARKYQSTITVKDDLGGAWNAIRNESAGVTIAGFSGWDRGAKHYVRVAFDSFGGMETKISDGWTGDDWVWTGTSSVAGKDAPLRHTITKHGDNAFDGKYEIQADGTAWTSIRTEHCKK